MRPKEAVLVATVVLGACSAPSGPEDRAAFVAAAVNAMAPKDLGDGATLTAASAEGSVLVLKMDGVVEWNTAVSDKEMADAIKPLACTDANYSKLISQGVGIRFELTSTSGLHLPPVTVSSCA